MKKFSKEHPNVKQSAILSEWQSDLSSLSPCASETKSQIRKIIKSKYLIPMLSLISILLCLFPVLTAQIATGETYVSVIRGYNLLEFSSVGSVVLIAPLLVPTIMHGCQTKAVKEIILEILLLGNSICYTHSVHKTWQWLYEIGGSFIRIKLALILYPIIFLVLCFVAIHKNADTLTADQRLV